MCASIIKSKHIGHKKSTFLSSTVELMPFKATARLVSEDEPLSLLAPSAELLFVRPCDDAGRNDDDDMMRRCGD